MCQEGTIEVWDASRPAKQEKEVDVCAENGIELIELPVAFDALSVVVSPDNDWTPCLTVEQLKMIFGPDSEGRDHQLEPGRSELPGPAVEDLRADDVFRDF